MNKPATFSPTAKSASVQRKTADQIIRIVVIAQLVLLVATRKLWWVISSTEFPRVPLIGNQLPLVADRACVIVFVLMCVAIAFKPGRRLAMVAVLAGLVLAVFNQHRLQPWHWLCCLMLASYVAKPASLRTMRSMVAAIYFYAALSRMGWPPDAGMTSSIATNLFSFFSARPLAANTLNIVVLTMTCVELTIGAGLMFRRFRRVAMLASVSMHCILLVALSPLGLNHHWGVLVWNLMFVLLNPMLFGRLDDEGDARILPILAFAFPLLGVFGLLDHWVSWKLYSYRSDVVRFFVAEEVVEKLPASVRPFVRPSFLSISPAYQGNAPDFNKTWYSVRLDQWSLQELNVPQYPQTRFQLAVARQILPNPVDPEDVFLTVQSSGVLPWSERTVVRATASER